MKSTLRQAAALLSAFGLLALSGAAMATNGYFTHGVGTESKGMAGTGIGSDGFAGPIVAASNPALSVFAGDGWEAGMSVFSPRRSYKAGDSLALGNGGAFTVGPGKIDSSSEWFPIPYVAKNFRLANEQVINLTFYGRGGMNTDWDDSDAHAYYDPTGGPVGERFEGTFGAGDAGVDLSQAFLAVNWSGKAGDNFAWGFGPVFAVQRFEATGVSSFQPFTRFFNECFFFQAPGTCDPTPSALSDNSHDTSTGFGFAGGVWWSMTDFLSAGLAYQSEIDMDEFDDYADLFAESGGFDIPSSLKFGLSFKTADGVRLNLDIEHTTYEDIASVGNPMVNLTSCPYPVYGAVLAQTGSMAQAIAAAQAADLESCLGGTRGGGFGWQDMTTYKVGMEWARDADTTWRFGYSYGEQPIRAEDVLFNILAPGVMEQHITFGMTKRRPNGGAWNLSVMYAPEHSVTGVSLFDPTQRIEIKMHQLEVEFSYLW